MKYKAIQMCWIISAAEQAENNEAWQDDTNGRI